MPDDAQVEQTTNQNKDQSEPQDTGVGGTGSWPTWQQVASAEELLDGISFGSYQHAVPMPADRPAGDAPLTAAQMAQWARRARSGLGLIPSAERAAGWLALAAVGQWNGDAPAGMPDQPLTADALWLFWPTMYAWRPGLPTRERIAPYVWDFITNARAWTDLGGFDLPSDFYSTAGNGGRRPAFTGFPFGRRPAFTGFPTELPGGGSGDGKPQESGDEGGEDDDTSLWPYVAAATGLAGLAGAAAVLLLI